MRVFIIECPNPMDILQERAEHQSLEKICKLIGHEVFPFLVRSATELDTVCRYISTIDFHHDVKKERSSPLCIHLSAHGNEDGLEFGWDFIEWKELFKIIQPITSSKRYPGVRIFIISACDASQQKITEEFTNEWKRKSVRGKSYRPPKYLFVFNQERVDWGDAVLAWTILYHQLPQIDLDNKQSVQDILRRMKQSNFGNLTYFRWDSPEKRFKQFKPK